VTIINKIALTSLALLGVILFEKAVAAQDVNRRGVKNFSEYQAEEKARMYEWYGHGHPPLIAPAAGPAVATRLERKPRREWWDGDVGIRRYEPPLGSRSRPFTIQVEPASPDAPVLLAPVR
jgi:hypothetical protein